MKRVALYVLWGIVTLLKMEIWCSSCRVEGKELRKVVVSPQLSHNGWMLGVENNITNTWKCSHLLLFYINLRLRAKLTVDISRCKSNEVTAVTSTYARGEFVPIFGTCWFCATALAHCIMSKSFWAMAACHWLSNTMHRVKHLPDNGPDLLFDMMHHATVPHPKASDRDSVGIW